MTDANPTAETKALALRSRAQDAAVIELRRELVATLRFVHYYTEAEIIDELAKQKPPIIVSRATVSRDIARARSTFRRILRIGNFDVRGEVGIIIAQLRYIIGSSFRDAKSTTDEQVKALHRKVALDAVKQLSDLLQRIGLINEYAFALPDDESKKAERLPSGDELRRRFDSLTIPEGELISEAERDWLYGDPMTAARAAHEAGKARNGGPEDE